MTDTNAALDAVPFRITNPELIPAQRYYDEEFYKAEKERLWPRVWQMACRHRGVRLVTGPGNCKREGCICPFHGWRFNAEGRNIFVFGKQVFSEELLDHAEIDLAPCRVEFWAGCAFINYDSPIKDIGF
ncbi:MAG TPA: Rieske 2Fe-2S domain-containing protein [Sphingobium sp.]